MSELLDGSQGSKPIPDCHDPSPAYDLGSSPDLLTSVMENERTRRLILQQLDKIDAESETLLKNHPINNRKLDYMELIEFMEWFVDEEARAVCYRGWETFKEILR